MDTYIARLYSVSPSLRSLRLPRTLAATRLVPKRGIAFFYASLKPPPAPILEMNRVARRICWPLKRHTSTFTDSAAKGVPDATQEPLQVGESVCSDLGKTYTIEEILLERRRFSMFVYRASCDGNQYVLKNSTPGDFEYFRTLMTKTLKSVPHVRPLVDTKASLELLIYPFLDTHLLDFALRDLSPTTRRNIVRDTLEGLANMHDCGVIHNDIKPNNILVNYQENGENEPTITAIQIGDIEDSVDISRGGGLIGGMCGNQLWRSPESWAAGLQNRPSDIFSFGILAIYVVLQWMIFKVPIEQLESEDSWRYILRNHIKYFGNTENLKGLLKYLGEDNPYFMRLIELSETFNASNPRNTIAGWQFGDEDFKDLISKMTNLDPTKRITAREALRHPWFSKKL